MNVKPKDPYEAVIKSQKHVSIRTLLDVSDESDDIFSEFETEQSQTRKSSNFGEIKQEMFKCEESKIEYRPWDLPPKNENEQLFFTTIKKEPTDIPSVLVERQENNENIQAKIKSELLTTSIDLPTLKIESNEYPDNLEQPCSSKRAKRTLKMLKTTKKIRRRYPSDVCQKGTIINQNNKKKSYRDECLPTSDLINLPMKSSDNKATRYLTSLEPSIFENGADNDNAESIDKCSNESYEKYSIKSEDSEGSVFCPTQNDIECSSMDSSESIIFEEHSLGVSENNEFKKTESKKNESNRNENEFKETEIPQINGQVDVSRRNHRIWDRKNLCPFCLMEQTHFARHIERKHADEPTVRKILSLPVGSSERKVSWDCLRKEGNFALFREEKKVIPVRRPTEDESKINAKCFNDFAVCSSCSGVYKKKTLSRHATRCSGRVTKNQKRGRLYSLTKSQTFLAAARCNNNFLLQSRLKNEVFDNMRADKISEVAKNDLLICLFGETRLKKYKSSQIASVTSNKMRELARLLIALKDDENNTKNRNAVKVKKLIEVMKPEFFDNLVAATKVIAGFNPDNKSFKASTLALHMGTSLKQLCKIIHRHIIEKSKLFYFNNPDLELKNIKHLQKLIEDHWTTEIASLALKDMT